MIDKKPSVAADGFLLVLINNFTEMNIMLRVLRLLFLLPLFMIACKGDDKGSGKHAKEKGCWYKRYTGSIAGVPVVVNLSINTALGEVSTTTVGGDYYYRGKSWLIDLVDKDSKEDTVHFVESVVSEREDELANVKTAEWFVKIDEGWIKGRWKSADGMKTYPIDLKESYEEGSYSFDVISYNDSSIFRTKDDEYEMSTEYNVLTPSAKMKKDDAAIIDKILMHELGGDTVGARDMSTFIKVMNKKDFELYLKTLKEWASDSDASGGERYNWDFNMNSYIEYNEKGIVVFDLSMYEFSGGAHPNSWSRYITVDVQEKKALHLNDMITVDTLKLNALLDKEARKVFGIKAGDPLSSALLVDTIPPTNNVILSDKGIVFHYNAYEVTPYVMGDAFLYLSYVQLGDMVKPEFKKRMKL
jgi:Deacetylase PdaC/Protein of unknown function (DUF3298)